MAADPFNPTVTHADICQVLCMFQNIAEPGEAYDRISSFLAALAAHSRATRSDIGIEDFSIAVWFWREMQKRDPEALKNWVKAMRVLSAVKVDAA